MTISHVDNGTPRNGVSAVVAEFPAVTTSGNLLIWSVVNKYPSAAPSTPTGFTQRIQQLGGAGGVAGQDIGEIFHTVFTKISDGTEGGGTQAVAVTGGNSVHAAMSQWTRSTGSTWDQVWVAGAQNTPSTSWSVAANGTLDLAVGDVVVVLSGNHGDIYNTNPVKSLSAPGITFSSATDFRALSTTTQGDDTSQLGQYYVVTAGSGTVTPTYALTWGGSASAALPAGTVIFGRLRESSGSTLPVITVNPEDISVDEGDTATFSVTATGATSYLWKRKAGGVGTGANVIGGSGATTASYTTPATTLTGSNHNDGDTYYCDVTNASGTVSSLEAALIVRDITPPDLVSPTITAGTLTATGTVITNKGEGTLYFLADNSATQTAAFIIANGSVQAITSTGSKSVNFGGLPSGTTYGHYVHVDNSGNESAAVHAGPVTVTGTAAVINTDPLRNNAGTLLASTTIAKVVAIRLSDMAVAAAWVNQTTAPSGVLTLSSGSSLVAGTSYLVVTSSTDGASTGSKLYSAG